MSSLINQFKELITAKFIDPSLKTNVEITNLVTEFKNEPLWLARALIVSKLLLNTDVEGQVMEIYKKLTSESKDPMIYIEAARAAAVFEDTDSFLTYLETAGTLCNFDPKVTGVEIKISEHQQTSIKRMACLIEPENNSSSSSLGNEFINVELHSDTEKFIKPQFVDKEIQEKATSLLKRNQYLLLLLHSNYTEQYNPAANTSVVSEQALPFIRRITDTDSFSKVEYSIAKHALYRRSVLEQKDINELERGTVQLLKLSQSIHSGVSPTQIENSLENFHFILPLSFVELDTMTARRLVAMSDFANAVPIYEKLNQPIDMAICYAAINQTDKALEVLKRPELENDPKALLLRGDICQDYDAYKRAFDEFKVPKAKLRLAQRALSQKDYSKSLSEVEEMLKISPNDYDGLMLASASSLALQNWPKSIVYLRRSLAIKEDDSRGWSDLATALIQNNQPEVAHHALEQSIRVNQNSNKDLPTATNYVALSAQLQKWDEVIFGLSSIAESTQKDAPEYIVKLSGLLPRLVESQLKQDFTNTGAQKKLISLFGEQLPKIIPSDDSMLLRLDATVKLWAHDYQRGLQQFKKAFDNLQNLPCDERVIQRIKLYGKEYANALERYGDKEGRFEGSVAFPQWKQEQQRVLKLI